MPFKKGQSGNINGKPKGVLNKSTKLNISQPLIVYLSQFTGVIKGDSYYVYKHSINGVCFYIGKGRGDRAWRFKECRNDVWRKYVESIGFKFDVTIISMGVSESEALIIESALIKNNKPICNIALK
jgi:hypothetical protein